MITEVKNNSFINNTINYDTDVYNNIVDKSYTFLNILFEKDCDIKTEIVLLSKLDLEYL